MLPPAGFGTTSLTVRVCGEAAPHVSASAAKMDRIFLAYPVVTHTPNM
jgi:hypothetical protein